MIYILATGEYSDYQILGLFEGDMTFEQFDPKAIVSAYLAAYPTREAQETEHLHAFVCRTLGLRSIDFVHISDDPYNPGLTGDLYHPIERIDGLRGLPEPAQRKRAIVSQIRRGRAWQGSVEFDAEEAQ